MNKVFAVPVKYMVIDSFEYLDYATYNIIDTSFEGKGKTVCRGLGTLEWAHHICKLINNAEGFEYAY
jgi:hypothetical protein